MTTKGKIHMSSNTLRIIILIGIVCAIINTWINPNMLAKIGITAYLLALAHHILKTKEI